MQSAEIITLQGLQSLLQRLHKIVQELHTNFFAQKCPFTFAMKSGKKMKFYEQDKDTAVLKMYTDIGWWDTNARNMSETIEQLSAKYKNIVIRAHCYGGNVFDGNVIYNSLKASKAFITIRIEGVAASMMTIVMCGADKIEICENGLVMIHCPTSYGGGNAKELQAQAKLLQMMEKNFIKKYADKTGKKESDIKALFDGADNWFDAEEAKAWGLVDEIVPAYVADLGQLAKPEPGTDPALVYNRYAALITNKEFINKTTTEVSMKKLLITMFSLMGVTEESSDADIASAVKAKMDGLENQVQAQSKAGIESLIAQAESSSGKTFDAATKAVLTDIGMKAGIEALQMSLKINTQPVAQSAATTTTTAAVPAVVSLMGNQQQNPSAVEMTWDEWQEKNPKGLQKMEDDNWEKYAALFKAKYGENPTK